MTVLQNPVRLIARTAQGSVYVSLSALKQAVFAFVKSQIGAQRLPVSLDRVEFVAFGHPVNLQVNVFVKAKVDDVLAAAGAAFPLQRDAIGFLGQEFNLEPLTLNVVCAPRRRAAS